MSQGATGGSFNTREFFHGKSALVVRNVKWIALGLAFALPAVLLFAATKAPTFWMLALAAASQLLGLLAEPSATKRTDPCHSNLSAFGAELF